jgi:hypothetical protein
MRVQQITRAPTLSVALAAIGLLAVAAPASATEVVQTRVELNRVVHKAAGHYSHYSVKGRIHSAPRFELCAQDGFAQLQLVNNHGRGRTDWSDGTNSRGEFSIRVPQSEAGSTVRVIVRRKIIGQGRKCDSDKSRRFTLGPASEAGVAAAASASAADDVKAFKTRVKVTRVVQTEAGDYALKGHVHSPDERCRKIARRRDVWLRYTEGFPRATDWIDDLTRRGKFSIRVPQSEAGSSFFVLAQGFRMGGGEPIFKCKADESRQFTLPPPS